MFRMWARAALESLFLGDDGMVDRDKIFRVYHDLKNRCPVLNHDVMVYMVAEMDIVRYMDAEGEEEK